MLVRAAFFALNLAFDALMWGLFTRALTLARSTVHVSVLNTSTNFMVAAAAGWIVFGEKLPPLWWAGAGMLMIGCALVAGREESGETEREELRGRMSWEENDLSTEEGGEQRIRMTSPYRDAEGKAQEHDVMMV